MWLWKNFQTKILLDTDVIKAREQNAGKSCFQNIIFE
jgi:hypothetical protein